MQLGTKVNRLDFEIKRSEFKVMTKCGQKSQVKNAPFWWRHSGRWFAIDDRL